MKPRPTPHKCATSRCRGRCAMYRPKKPHMEWRHEKYCSACKSQNWKKRAPIKYYFKEIRHSAKRRRMDFSLDFKCFGCLCLLTGYHLQQGPLSGETLTVDRKINSLGYVQGNIRVITNSANVAKGNRERYVYEKIYGYKTEAA